MPRYAKAMNIARVIKSDHPLSIAEIIDSVPSVAMTYKHPRMSEGYTYIPTREVLNSLLTQGFAPFYAAQQYVKHEANTNFARHLVRLRHQDTFGKDLEDVNELVLINSHDGSSSYQLMAGCFRMICANGLFAGEGITAVRIPHRGNILDKVLVAANEVSTDFKRVDMHKNAMKHAEISKDKSLELAERAIALRYPKQEDRYIAPNDLLQPMRYADCDVTKSVWAAYNIIQERLMRGGLRTTTGTSHKRRSYTRAIPPLAGISLNRNLWSLALEYAV